MFKLFALLPFISMSLLVVYFMRQGFCRRSALLAAAVAWGVILIMITEVLSLFHLLNFQWLSIAWVLTTILLACMYFYADNKMQLQLNAPFTLFTKLLLYCTGGIVITAGITAVVAPPNTWDSMTYHMSRVMHWIQNQSVAHYPTNIIRQIELNPWAEFAITNFQILSKGDYLANLVQWFCMIGSILGVTLIAEKLGADHRGQIFAAVVAATIPMGILQSSSTQNDYVVSFWLVCLVYFGIRFNEKPCWSYATAVGASLGLSLLTKGTAYLYAFPLLIWLVVSSLKSIKLMAVKYIVIIMLVAISLNSGHYIRNYVTFGNILSSGETKYSNGSYGMATLTSNVIRNIALEMGSSFKYANQAIISGACLLHMSMGLDIDDNETTLPGTKFSISSSRHEDAAGNPLHLLLIIFSIFAICFSKNMRHQHNVLPYLSALVIAFICFSFYLRWQPWQNRLLLPLIILWSPLIALVIAKIKSTWVANTILISLVCMALPFLLLNKSRPLITVENTESILETDRISQYFNNRPNLMQQYYELALYLKLINCSNIALQTGENAWEYPLWVLLQKEFDQNIRIEHVKVDNMSDKIPLNNFIYCYVVPIDR